MEMFTEDAVVTLNLGLEPPVTYTGKAEIRGWAEGFLGENLRISIKASNENSGVLATSSSWWMDWARDMGIAPLNCQEVFTVKDGKLQGFRFTIAPGMVPEEAIDAAMTALVLLPETGGGPLPTEGVLVGLGALAVAGGMSLERLRRRW